MTEIRPAIFNAASAIANKLGGELNITELLMAIQMERANILESQIRDQMSDMKRRNDWLKDANEALAALRTKTPSSADGKVEVKDITFRTSSGDTVSAMAWLQSQGVYKGESNYAQYASDQAALAAVKTALAENKTPGRTLNAENTPSFVDAAGGTRNTLEYFKERYPTIDYSFGGLVDARQQLVNISNQLEFGGGPNAVVNGKLVPAKPLPAPNESLSKTQMETFVSNLKSAIDTVNSQSQLDMVRLQGLMDKRNQAYDMMTNIQSKSGKSLESVIGNMR